MKPSVRISSTRIFSAIAASRTPSIPPMFTIASFFALIVKPSQRSNISRAMALSVRWCSDGSSLLIANEFSANRHASRKSGISASRQRSETARRFRIDTAWPPTVLLVTVITTSATATRELAELASKAARSMLPPNVPSRSSPAGRCPWRRSSRRSRGSCRRARSRGPSCPTARSPHRGCARPRALGAAGNTKGIPVSSCATRSKRNQLRAPAYDSSPRIIAAHCSALIAPVPESVKRSMMTSSARSAEEVVLRLLEHPPPLARRRHADGFDDLDTERFDDGSGHVPRAPSKSVLATVHRKKRHSPIAPRAHRLRARAWHSRSGSALSAQRSARGRRRPAQRERVRVLGADVAGARVA